MLEFITTLFLFFHFSLLREALVLKNNTRKENDKRQTTKGRTKNMAEKKKKLKIQFSFIDFRGFPTLSL